jgi:hypothetical protein
LNPAVHPLWKNILGGEARSAEGADSPLLG